LQKPFASPFLKSEITQETALFPADSVTDRFRAVQVGIQKGSHWAVKEMSCGNVLRAAAVAREVQKGMEAGYPLGSQRADFAEGKLISGTKPPRQGKGTVTQRIQGFWNQGHRLRWNNHSMPIVWDSSST